jgi:hypothetical protein
MFVTTGHHSQKNNKNILAAQSPVHSDPIIVTHYLVPTKMAQTSLKEAVATVLLATILKKRVSF